MSLTQTNAPAKKQRPPPKSAVVESVEQVTPGLMRISVTGPDLAPFAASKPAGHMKLFFPEGPWPPAGGVENAPRPPSRTYTPRRYDVAAKRLEIEFVLHGAGLASDWAVRAKPGDTLLLSAGPGGGYAMPESVTHLVVVADDTALPAVGMILEALPRDCAVTILAEIEDGREERALSPIVSSAPQWLHRKPGGAQPGALLEAAVAALPAQPAGTQFWIACEAGAMRRMRDFLLTQRQIERGLLHTRGYWRAGDMNYPDHDYGND